MEKLNIIITLSDENVRLDRFVKMHYSGMSQSSIEKALRNGLIKINNKKSKSNYRTQNNDILTIAEILIENCKKDLPKPIIKAPSKYLIDDLRKSILYNDENIIVINKQSGLATQGGSKIKDSIDNIIKFLPEFSDHNPKLVHRLDKETSGVMIIACNNSSARILTQAFREKKVIKNYIALVTGVPEQNQGIIDLPIEKLNNDNYEKVLPSKTGDRAITRYEVIDSLSDEASIVMFTPITGRTHQIRVHARSIGNPIIGDKKYGFFNETLMIDQDKLNLHSFIIDLGNIFKNHIFKAPLPKYMIDNIKSLGLQLRIN